MPMELPMVLRAAEAAAHWHSSQKRKGAAGEPYISHLIEVARLVAEATNGEEPHLVAAALLHDAVEDQNIPLSQIASMFGDDVAALVGEVTDDKSLPKAVRKRMQVEHAPHMSDRAKILKLADKISNVRAIGASPPPDWTMERRRDYIDWSREVVAGLGEACPYLQQQFELTAQQADRLIEGSA